MLRMIQSSSNHKRERFGSVRCRLVLQRWSACTVGSKKSGVGGGASTLAPCYGRQEVSAGNGEVARI